jgi:hypothetical protein
MAIALEARDPAVIDPAVIGVETVWIVREVPRPGAHAPRDRNSNKLAMGKERFWCEFLSLKMNLTCVRRSPSR